jgi:hypothetical protein
VALLNLSGTNRTRYLNEVRNSQTFRVERPVTLLVEGIYTAPDERLVWMECQQGTWRLPAEMHGWAEAIEDRARVIVGRDDILPCRIVFVPRPNGAYEVELRPTGYQPFLPS